MKTKRGWVTILFAQGEEAYPFLDILEEKGERACIREMSQWDMGTEMDHSPTQEEPWGTSDHIRKALGYVLSYNTRIGYIALNRKENKVKE